MLRTRPFYLLWLMYMLGASAGLMMISNIAIIANEQAAWEAGFVPVMILAVFNTLGRFGSGAVSDRIGRTNTMIIAFVLQALNMFLFVQYTSPFAINIAVSITGICYGALFALMPAATADFYGLKNLGVNYGLVFTSF
jgi:OFA family oxalate/formate antiporter-like MFS transporter